MGRAQISLGGAAMRFKRVRRLSRGAEHLSACLIVLTPLLPHQRPTLSEICTVQVFQDPTRRRSCYWMAGAVLALFALYLLGLHYFRSRSRP